MIGRRVYLGLFLVTLATLTYEVLLTRIFSVTMWYHFAFMAISIAMFGMTFGAILVYLLPRIFTPERTRHHLSRSALLFAVTVVLSFIAHLLIPFPSARSLAGHSIASLASVFATYAAIAVPFTFSGICVSLALTRFPRHIGSLYAADLAGAALGCVLVVYLLRITDGPTAVVVTAALASAGALVFAAGRGERRLARASAWITAGLVLFSIGSSVLAARQSPLLRLSWAKGQRQARPLHETWNSFSRITVEGTPDVAAPPSGWGLSDTYPAGTLVREIGLAIDSFAWSVMTRFDGDLDGIEHLKYDVTNIVHYVRPQSKVLVVGVGGGRDILSCLAFGQDSVLAVELNADILRVVNDRFGDYTGHLDRYPNVRFVAAEARSFVAGSSESFDVIQVSLIDTFAATAAGAFVLAENGLYTTEAWKLFLDHLTPDGVLTFSRWYFRDYPGEVYRLVSLAAGAIEKSGGRDPRSRIIVVRYIPKDEAVGIGTLLVGKRPFTAAEQETVRTVADRMGFDVVLDPEHAIDPVFAGIASGDDARALGASLPIDVTPPTDDKPFFFHMLRLRDAFRPSAWNQAANRTSMAGVSILAALLLVVMLLTLACFVVPLRLTARRTPLRGNRLLFVFFIAIGLGFMLVEVSQMQRLIVFLGHPTYGLTVVLFTLLLSGGIGSLLTSRTTDAALNRGGAWTLAALLAMILAFGILTPRAMPAFAGYPTPARIALTVGMLFPLGLLMGTAFPLGMRLASARDRALTPWLWGMNGAASVCASVLAVAVALSAGISAAYWLGFLCYAAAFVAFLAATRSEASISSRGVVTASDS